ncbi:MAG: DNA polymerase III subunit delta [Clostridiales bacterium]|jgi:DNA polymerase-3 subunit delta|nr:DNA polymerase III subunit delta [Eubacteriales bacterium]MDH7566663.1 DNA polymerase III subunit delta [Clostridiales bacterium]
MSLDALKKDIKSNKIKSLYLFYGQEEYLKKYYVDAIERVLLKDELKALNRITFEGKADVKGIMDACETVPVFSERKVVIVKNSGLFKPKKKTDEDGSKFQSNDFSGYIKAIPEHACLIFVEEEIDKRLKLVETIKTYGLMVEFGLQKPAELVKWVVKVFRSYGKYIDTPVASHLVDICEPGMYEILNEINKVLLYMGNREKVSMDDLEEVCTKSVKSRIFDLTDAIAERNGAKALRMLDEMITLKEPLPKILIMIGRQFCHILEMKLLAEEGMSTAEAASRLGITPYAAGKILKQAGNFAAQDLREAVRESLEMDIAVKTGKLNDRLAAEILIGKYSCK